MKNILTITAFALLSVFGSAFPVSANPLVIGLSPYQEQVTATKQAKQVILFLSEVLEPGDSALILDAYNLSTIGTFSIPDKPAYRNPKAKVGANRAAVASLLAFGKAAKAPQAGDLSLVSGSIRLPQFVAHVGGQVASGKETQVLVWGNPLYSVPEEPQFSMKVGHIPNDGHLLHSRKDTPFGTKGRDKLLANVQVHLGTGDHWRLNDQHGYLVQRFWTLYLERQGGALASFTSDTATLFRRVKDQAPAPPHDFVLEPSDKLEMNLFRYKVDKEEISIYERPVSTQPVSPALARKAEGVEIGLSWDCPSCDLDVHAQAHPQAQVLNFINTSTPEGQYFKDFTSSPRPTQGYETIAYRVPVDLTKLRLAINFFGGAVSKNIEVELRISFQGLTYMQRYQVAARTGNKGVGRESTFRSGKPANLNWIVIDPLQVVGLRDES